MTDRPPAETTDDPAPRDRTSPLDRRTPTAVIAATVNDLAEHLRDHLDAGSAPVTIESADPTTTASFVDAVTRLSTDPAHVAAVVDDPTAARTARRAGVGMVVAIGTGADDADLEVDTVGALPPDLGGWASAAPGPSDALDDFEAVLAAAPKPAVFLDYDGTLTPLVDDPDDAVIDDDARRVLERLAAAVPVALISGRGLADLASKVRADGITVAGSHGFEIEWPTGERFELPEVETLVPVLREVGRRLDEELDGLPGVAVEHKPFAIAVHTRRAETEEARTTAHSVAERIGTSTEGLRVTGGKEITELRPDIDWHKGRAVEHVLSLLPGDRTPLFIGDDETDEDGLAAVRRLGGVGIRVGPTPGLDESWADHTLADPASAIRFLDRLADALS